MENSRIEEVMAQYTNPFEDKKKEVKSAISKIKETAQKNFNNEVYIKCLNCMDITSLHTEDTEESIADFTCKVNTMKKEFNLKEGVAAICVYPSMVSTVKNTLNDSNVKIAAVTGGFPHSQTFMEVKIAETSMAIMEGANEIDIVLSLAKFRAKDYEGTAEEIAELKDCCHGNHLKVILESGAMRSYEELYNASILALESGADFIKTSTGKQKPAATPEAAYVMCTAIKDFYIKRREKRGFKSAGGISTAEDAALYYSIVEEVLGEEWLNNRLFRIGASSLANNIIGTLENREIKFF